MSVDKLAEAIKVFGPVLTQTYGQAEACMICTFFSPEDHVAALDEQQAPPAGELRPDLALDAARGHGRRRPHPAARRARRDRGARRPGHGGLLQQRRRRPREASAFGWHHTGDIGVIDEDGFVYIVDRKKDMIISGGFNVFPSEVEQVLWSHPAVQDCAVIGVPDEKWGEAVKAVVELKPGAAGDAPTS